MRMREAFEAKKKQWNRMLRRKTKEKEMDSRSWHSLAYHRHFEGYTEYQTVTAGGRKKIVRQYRGPVYRQRLSRPAQVLTRCVYLLLWLLMASVLLLAGMTDRASDSTWYLAVTELAAILLLTFQGYNLLVNYLFLMGDMTVGDYRSGSRGMIRNAFGLAVCFGLSGAETVLYSLSHPALAGGADYRAAAWFLTGGVSALAMLFLEKNIPYDITAPKEREADHDEVEILYRV